MFKPGYNGVHNFTEANLTDKDVQNQDPLFVAAVNGNFSLKANSPAKAKGFNFSMVFTDDYNSVIRNGTWILGAIQ